MSPPDGGVDASVEALKRTQQSLASIQRRLRPFLRLAAADSAAEAEERALSQAAVALSIATLRVVGHRLRGSDRGRAPDDPLRQELNRIRTALRAASDRCKAKKERNNNGKIPSKVAPESAGIPSLDEAESALPRSSAKRKQSSHQEEEGRCSETISLGTAEPSKSSTEASAPSKRRRRG
jgi:hypothetical protein